MAVPRICSRFAMLLCCKLDLGGKTMAERVSCRKHDHDFCTHIHTPPNTSGNAACNWFNPILVKQLLLKWCRINKFCGFQEGLYRQPSISILTPLHGSNLPYWPGCYGILNNKKKGTFLLKLATKEKFPMCLSFHAAFHYHGLSWFVIWNCLQQPKHLLTTK